MLIKEKDSFQRRYAEKGILGYETTEPGLTVVRVAGTGPVELSLLTESDVLGKRSLQWLYTPQTQQTHAAAENAEIFDDEEIQRRELTLRDGVNNYRRRKADLIPQPELKPGPLTRLSVLDMAAHIQTRYISEQNVSPLTHTVDFDWLTANYGNEVTVLGLTPVVRSRGRVDIASLIQLGRTGQSYAKSGGVSELLVAGTDDPNVALAALIASPYHEPALRSERYIHAGIRGLQAQNGRMVWSVVLGQGLSTELTWPISTRGFTNQVYLPIVSGTSQG